MTSRTVLHVGCGQKRLQQLPSGFQDGTWTEIRLDIDPGTTPDVIGSMTDMSVVPDASVDAIYSSHNIEHLFHHELSVALGNFVRVLRPSGFAVITCPDLQSIGSLVAEGRLLDVLYHSAAGPIAALDILFGHRASIAAGNHFMAHRCGFTNRTLLDTLVEANFATIRVVRRPRRFDLWGFATKQVSSDDEINALLKRYGDLT